MSDILYSAVILDGKSKKLLIDSFPSIIPDDWKIFAHHMTIVFGKGLPKDLENQLGLNVELNVIEFGYSDDVMAVKVNGFSSVNKIPHITLAVDLKNGGKPVNSNYITNWKKIKDVIGKNDLRLIGTVEEIKKQK